MAGRSKLAGFHQLRFSNSLIEANRMLLGKTTPVCRLKPSYSRTRAGVTNRPYLPPWGVAEEMNKGSVSRQRKRLRKMVDATGIEPVTPSV
jgi:hypothetical protein